MPTTTTKPIPRATPELAPFLAAARERKLVVQQCTECRTLRFPPREVCSSCWSHASAWIPVSGRGTLYSFYRMHQVYHPAFAGEVPYAVVIVELDEGPRMTSNLVDAAPGDLRIGARVEVVFEDLTDEVSLPKFRPAPG